MKHRVSRDLFTKLIPKSCQEVADYLKLALPSFTTKNKKIIINSLDFDIKKKGKFYYYINYELK